MAMNPIPERKRQLAGHLVERRASKRLKTDGANGAGTRSGSDDDEYCGIAHRMTALTPLSPPAYNSDNDSDGELPRQKIPRPHVAVSSTCSRHSAHSSAGARVHRRRRSMVPDADKIARQRCFDYLVSAIDAVWAQYCDCTSNAESENYPENLPCSPVSLYEEDYSSCPEDQPHTPRPRAASEQPRSVRLMNLKKRLLNAKYFFVDLLDSCDADRSSEFWRRWDLVKYATIELVEEADDDDTVEEVTEELEAGRYYSARN